MADFSKLQADVAAQTTVIAGVQTLLANLVQQISDLKNAGTSDPAVQAAIDSLATSVEANNAALSAAVAANTPAAPAPAAAPADATAASS